MFVNSSPIPSNKNPRNTNTKTGNENDRGSKQFHINNNCRFTSILILITLDITSIFAEKTYLFSFFADFLSFVRKYYFIYLNIYFVLV